MDYQNENIALVKRLYSLFAERNINAILEMLDPDVEWSEPENPFNPAAGTRFGHQGFLEWAKIGHEADDVLILEPHKFLADNDTVAVIGYNKCLAIPTMITFESDYVHVFTIKNGKILKFQEFFDTYIAGEAFRE